MKLHRVVAMLLGAALLAVSRTGAAQPAPEPSTTERAGDVTPPAVVQDAQPIYPPQALAQGRTAAVVLVLDIDTEGKVVRATVQEPVGFGFDEAAREAALRLKFEPARRNGQKIASRILYRSRFELAPPPPAVAPAAPAPPLPGSLAGVVRLATVDAPLAGVTIRVRLADGRVLLATTDIEGRWELAGVEAGKVDIKVSSPGFDGAAFEEQVAAGERLELVYRLRPAAQPLEVQIRGDRPDREVTRRTVRRQELALLPGTGGDALRSLQTMPGVARADPFGGMLIVRGSSPQGTAVFVDGTPVPVVYHFGGLSSVIPTEMIESIDFFPGSFSARYGRVNGGIVDVHLRDMTHDGKLHGLGQVDFIDARLLLTGPIPLLDGWSFEAAGRRSHVDVWAQHWLGDFAKVRRAPVYYDWQLFAETRPSRSSSLRIGMFGSDDRMSLVLDDAIPQDPGMGASTRQQTSALRWQAVYHDALSERVSLSATASVGRDRDELEFGALQADTTYRPVALRGELQWKLADGWTMRAGPDLVFTHYAADVRTILPPDTSAPDPGPLSARPLLTMKSSGWLSTPAGYAELEWLPASALMFLYGARVDYHAWTGRTDVSPRFNGRYDLRPEFPRSTVKAGIGLFYEPPQPVEVSDVFGTPSLRSNRSVHYTVGVEQQLSEAVEVSVEGFIKTLDDLVVRRAMADGSLGYDNAGSGRVVGAEVLLRHRPAGRFFGWVAYSLSRSTRVDGPGEAQHLFEYDQTHVMTALGSLKLGRGWTLGGRFRLVTGNPYTPCLGGIQNAGTGTYACRSGAPFSQRLPAWHQADVRVDKLWTFDDWRLTAYLDVQNVYDRSNPEAVEYNYSFTRTRFQSGLPILPSLGLRGEF